MTRFLTQIVLLMSAFTAGAYAMALHVRHAAPQATVIDDRGAVPVRGSVTLKQAALGQYTLSFEGLTTSKSGKDKPHGVRVLLCADAINVHGIPEAGEMSVGDVTGCMLADLDEEHQ